MEYIEHSDEERAMRIADQKHRFAIVSDIALHPFYYMGIVIQEY
jgi:hypothetical protein